MDLTDRASTRWSGLSKQQAGQVGEWLAATEFMLAGFETFGTDVDDRGVDLLVRRNGVVWDVQVKSLRAAASSSYAFMRKRHFQLRQDLLLTLCLLEDGQAPSLYLIPSLEWEQPNALLKDRDYAGEGQTSQPEWGLSLAQGNRELLEQYAFHVQAARL